VKYYPRQYALALRAALKEKTAKEQKNILRHFLRLIVKNKDLSKLNLIINEVEREGRKTKGILKVEISSSHLPSEGFKTKLKKILGKKIFFVDKIDPNLLAGLKILIEDETLIDATAKNQLVRLFKK